VFDFQKASNPDADAEPHNIAIMVAVVALIFLVPCVGMLATGILIHAGPKFPAASSTEHIVVLGMAVILFGAPIAWLYHRSKQAPGYVVAAAAALWVGGVVASSFYAIVALVIAAILFSIVASADRIGVSAVVGAGLTVLLGAVAPGFLWWSWTTLGGLSALF
jgi:hypothetical protein